MGALRSLSWLLVFAFCTNAVAEALATPLPFANVKNACLDPRDDMKVLAWSYRGGYLLCVTGDENAEGEAIYRERAVGSGRFVLVKAVGGYFRARDLVRYGVPPSIARELFGEVQRHLNC